MSRACGVRKPGRRCSRRFESETDYFGSRTQQAMINFRVRDLDAMLAQLRAKGADVAQETQDMEGVESTPASTSSESRDPSGGRDRQEPQPIEPASPVI